MKMLDEFLHQENISEQVGLGSFFEEESVRVT